MKKYLIIIILLSLFIEAKTFTEVEFKGDVDLITGEFDRSTLLKICHIEYPPIYKVWKADPIFEEEQISKFVENLKSYAQSMGYYRVKVFPKMTKDTIILNIQKHEPIKIKSIKLNKEFDSFALFKKGKRFRTKDFTQTKKRITRYLEENGYPTYGMNAKAKVDLDLYQVDIVIKIKKGKKRYFGETDVNNSSKIDQELITEQIVYEKDELFNILKLEESYDNIYRLGVFSKIQVEADFNNSDGISDVGINLEEGETKEILSRLGYDTQDGVRGAVDYIDHNFFGNLREFTTGLKISERGYRAYTGFYDPKIVVPIFGKFSMRNELSYHDWKFDGYDEALLLEKFTLGRELFRLKHFFGFQHEYNTISSDNPDLLSGSYLINSLFYRVVIDERDSVMNARNGYYLSFYAEKAMHAIGSEIEYLKLLAEGRYIKELDPVVVAFKLKVGTLNHETPLFKHFFTGGAMSNRGYEYRDLGPHTKGDATGGVGVIDTSLEVRYPLSENFSVVSFFDASTISEEVQKFHDDWYRSYGLGMRYISIIGPLRFDIGFQEGGAFALHLGIGQVF
jgi:translocation and assembly module TamA